MANFQGNRINPTRFNRANKIPHYCISIVNIYDTPCNFYNMSGV